MKFIITIDTEADNQWARSQEVSLRNIDFIPRFQELCDRYHFKPTYLITYEMATSEKFIETVGRYQTEKRAEIGAHLHPWTNPPLIPLTEDDLRYHPFPHEYPDEVLREKLTVLTDIIEKNFGRRPVTFRAGRYGFDGTVAAILSELGYLADCSVTPLSSWKRIRGNPRGQGGPDFSGAPLQAYQIGKFRLLEVPISIFFTKLLALNSVVPRMKQIFHDPQNVLLRGLYKLGYAPVWFRPHPDRTLDELLAVYKTARALRMEHLEMMFHSSELMPGGSKNTQTPEAIERLYTLLQGVFQALSAENIESMTLRDYAESVQ